MSKVKELFTNWRILVLIAAIILAVVSINPTFGQQGVAIQSVEKNSTAARAGISSPESNVAPRSLEVIKSINNIPINSVEEYHNLTSNLPVNQSISVKTNRDTYILETEEKINITKTGRNITRNVTEEVFNETLNKTVNVTRRVTEPEVVRTPTGEVADLGINVIEAPTTNIRKGLDLTGGTRVILQPQSEVSEDDMELLLENIQQRLNVFGLSDVTVRSASDLRGNQFVIVEIAGVTQERVTELISEQGVFEAKIGNKSVFTGGDDVTYVCRSAECSGIDSQRGCNQQQNGRWICGFRFQISLSPDAAERQADITRNLSVVEGQGGGYLSKPLDLYLDGEKVDSLQIAASLQGSAVTDISITGSGNGTTRREATDDALQEMKRLQTILITGSLPVQLDIARVDELSPVLGEQFLQNAINIGLFAILSVVLTVFIRYRRFAVSIPMIIAMLSEALLILGVAAIIGWNLDLAAIAGIIIAIGTGVDDQIVITDETLTKRGRSRGKGWKERLKRAFFIIFAAYFTLVVAMIPLWFAGAGMLRGFAITTILGVSVGVFITRPAFAEMVEIFAEEY